MNNCYYSLLTFTILRRGRSVSIPEFLRELALAGELEQVADIAQTQIGIRQQIDPFLQPILCDVIGNGHTRIVNKVPGKATAVQTDSTADCIYIQRFQ